MLDDILLLQKRHEEYLARRQELFSEYMQLEPQFKEIPLFFCFNGCKTSRLRPRHLEAVFSAQELECLLSDTASNFHNGGYFFRWNQKGICINPSEGFLERFCEFGHHIWEIDTIIASSAHTNASKELELIYTLNKKLNSMLVSYEQEPHVIQYLLHPAVFARTNFRPLFREEKGSVICLEAFQQEEPLAIDDQISFFYANRDADTLMIRLKMAGKQFGYLSSGKWESRCSQFFQECSLMLMGVGKIDLEEFENMGCARALYELKNLELLLISEFDSSRGDIRLEIVKQLKREKKVIPLDHGFVMNLESLLVKTDTETLPPYHFTPYQEVSVARTQEAFSQLLYLGPENIV